jgi:pimeloyl-ACP methyl ester carboxylesterase
LTNRITCEGANNDTLRKVEDESSIPTTNLSKTINGIGLANINNKPLYYQNIGSGEDSIILIHGLGGTTECWYPLISTLSLEKSHSLHLFDLEGHGISPTSPLSVLSMASFADDLKGIYEHAGISSATIIAHSLGSLVALTFSIAHPQLVKRLILLGPPPSPLPDAFIGMLISRAATVRTKGMASIVDFNYKPSISQKVRDTNPIVTAALRLVMMGQDPEGYAKACSALAGVKSALEVERLNVETLIITGDEDEISSPEVCQQYAKLMKAREPVILNGVGHWHMFEDVTGVASAIKTFLSRNVTVL